MKQPSSVLLIDDDEDDGYFFNEALKKLPYKVEFRHDQDSEDALLKLSENGFNPPDILFLDWNMPKINGRQCLLALRKMPQYASVPIIVYSTSNRPELIEESRRLGASYFLTKPPVLRELVEQLQNIFSKDWDAKGA